MAMMRLTGRLFRKGIRTMAKSQKKTAAAEKSSRQERQAREGKILVITACVMGAIILAFVLSILAGQIFQSDWFKQRANAVSVDGEKLSVADYNFYFYRSYYEFLNNVGTDETGMYASPQADIPLSEQYMDEEKNVTWQEYFDNRAQTLLKDTYAYYHLAQNAGFTLSEEMQDDIQYDYDEKIWFEAVEVGHSTEADYLAQNYGAGMTKDIYMKNLTVLYTAKYYKDFYRESIEISPEELDAYYASHAGDYRSVQIPGLRGQMFQHHKGAVFQLPGKGVVLGHAHTAAANDLAGLLLFQQKTHYRGLGEGLFHTVMDAGKAGVLQHRFQKTRPIVGIDADDALLHFRPAEGGGVHRQVAALGMAPQPQDAGTVPGGLSQIAHRLRLRGDGGLKGHVEVLFPPHQGGIGAAKGHIGPVMPQTKGHGGKLLFLRRVQDLPEAAHPEITEAGAGSQGAEQRPEVLRGKGTGEHGGKMLRAIQLRQAQTVPGPHRRQGIGQMYVGGAGQDQTVYIAEGARVKGVQHLCRVADDIVHGNTSERTVFPQDTAGRLRMFAGDGVYGCCLQ